MNHMSDYNSNRIEGDDVFNEHSSARGIPRGTRVVRGGPEQIFEIVELIMKNGGMDLFMKWMLKDGLQMIKTEMIRIKHPDLRVGTDEFTEMAVKEHDKYVTKAAKLLKILQKEIGDKDGNIDGADVIVLSSLIMENVLLTTFGEAVDEAKEKYRQHKCPLRNRSNTRIS